MQANNYNTNFLAVMGRQFSSLLKAEMRLISIVLQCCLSIGALAVAFDTRATSELADHFSSDLDNYSEINITNASYGTISITQISSGLSAENIAKVAQKYGYGNEATLEQSGNGNRVTVTQVGLFNGAEIVQNGDENKAWVAQWGFSEVNINQQGDRNKAIVGPVGLASVEINQTGNGNVKVVPPPGFINIVINQ
jgi:minor curlin subunit